MYLVYTYKVSSVKNEWMIKNKGALIALCVHVRYVCAYVGMLVQKMESECE